MDWAKASNFKRAGRRSPFLRYGAPLISLTVLGWIGIGYMHQGRNQIKNTKDDVAWAFLRATRSLSREGPVPDLPPKKKLDLQEELQNLKAKVDLDPESIEYVPVPRPRSE